MADENDAGNTETVTTATAKDNGPLTSPTGQNLQAVLEAAVKAQEALDARGNADGEEAAADQNFKERQQALEALKENKTVQSAEEEPPKTAKAEADPEKDGNEEATDDLEKAAEGEAREVPVRKTRLNKLLDKAHKYDEIIEKLSLQSLEPDAKTKSEPVADPTKDDGSIEFVQKKIIETRDALKKAVSDFEREKEVDLQEQLIDLKAEAKIRLARAEDKVSNQKLGWQGNFQQAEATHKATREALWNEDVARVEALDDPNMDLEDVQSPLHRAVESQIREWHEKQHPILLKPDAWRMAVEIAARGFGIDLPAIKPKAAPSIEPTKPTVPPVKSEPNVHRKTSTAIQATSPGAKGAPSQQAVLEALTKLSPDKRLELLGNVLDQRQKVARTKAYV